MGALPSSEPFAFRFAPYIKELREFLASSRLHYGSPEDIFPVTERLQNSKAFAEDMSSMIRSILLREGGSMAHAQLLEILAIAIGGPEMDHAPQAFRQPLRQLLSFLTGVLRRPWNLPPGEEPEPPAPAPVATYSSSSDTFDHPEVVNFPSGPSGPFAAAAALAAAEPKQGVAKPPARELNPPATSPELLDRTPFDAETEVEAAAPLEPSASVPVEPEYSEREFAEYEALTPTPSEPAIEAAILETAEPIETAATTESPEEPQSALEALPAEAPALLETETIETEIAAAEAVEPQSVDPPAALEPVPESAIFEPQADPEPAVTMAEPVPEAMHEPLASAAPEPEPLALAPDDPEPLAVSDPTPEAPQPVAASTAPAAPASATPAYAAVTAVAKWPRHHTPSLSSWHESPFDDSYPEFEVLPSESAVKARSAAAPWISPTDDTPGNPPWMSASTRNVLIAGAAAIAVAVLVAVALRPAPEPSEPVVTAAVPASTSPANSSATSLTPQPSPTSAAALPAKPTPYGDPFTPQQNPSRPPRTRSSEDDEYTGTDVAPPHYRSFVTPPASSATGTGQSAPQSSPANAGQSANVANSTPQSAPVERRSPETSLLAEPARQSFRNPDATLVGDSRPVRPMTPSRSLSGEPTFHVSSGVMAANLISAPNPDYPTFARMTHTHGEVIIQAVISRDGRVSAIHVLSGHRLLRGAAVDAVKRWRYRPYIADGHPVDVATIIRVDFRAHN